MAMASSKVVGTNQDLPRQSSVCSLSSLLAEADEPHPSSNSKNITMDMDDLLNSIYSSSSEPNPNPQPPTPKDMPSNSNSNSNSKTVDEVWKEIVAGTGTGTGTGSATTQSQQHMTLEDFLTKAAAGAVGDTHTHTHHDHVTLTPLPTHFPIANGTTTVPVVGVGVGVGVGVSSPPPGTAGTGRGKRRAVEEPVVDKATLQKQKRMIKNRESAARSRERKQAYTVELESLVIQLEEENARLLREEADNNKQRFKQLMECLIPVVEKRKPRRMLRRVNSVQW